MRVSHSALTKLLVIALTTVLLLTMAACSSSSSSSPDADVTINLTASGTVFDKSSITVSAGDTVAIVFDNKDSILHNFALYETSAAANSIFVGELISKKIITYTFTAPKTPGTYFFRCDVHPSLMTGEFIVT